MTLTASIEVLRNSADEFPERARTALSLLTADLDRFQQLVEDLLEISGSTPERLIFDSSPSSSPRWSRAAVGVSSDHPVQIDVDESVDELVINVDKRRVVRSWRTSSATPRSTPMGRPSLPRTSARRPAFRRRAPRLRAPHRRSRPTGQLGPQQR